MAGVQDMAFTAGGFPSSADKEKGAICWQDAAAEVGSAAFFNQFVELGDSDAESPAGGGGGFGQVCGAPALPVSPQLSLDQMLGPGGTLGAAAQGQLLPAVSRGDASPGAAARVSQPRQPQIHLSTCRAATDMSPFSKPEMELCGMSHGSFGEAPGGGSISDSELLKLEGLTMRSPRPRVPQPSASEPSSPPPKSTSPRKASRLQTFCTKIRDKAATLHGKAKQGAKQEPDALLSVPVVSTAQMEPARPAGRPRPHDLDISTAQLPSPPLTSGMPSTGRDSAGGGRSDASLVNQFLEDPFLHGGLLGGQYVPPLQLQGGAMPQTPLSTPLLEAWQLAAPAGGGEVPWAGGQYSLDTANWWDPSDAMDTDPLPLPGSGLQLPPQPASEYPPPPGAEDAVPFTPDGLMLHMPQPRGVPSAVLHSADAAAHRPARADHRRPKPRAPSSGARHLSYGPGVSPRKGRAASGGGSNAGRLRSVSPSPRTHSAAAGGPGGRLHRRSASMQTLHQPGAADGPAPHATAAAIRKRRSWTGRRTSSSSSSSSLHHQYHALAAASTTPASPSRGAVPASSSSAQAPPYAFPAQPMHALYAMNIAAAHHKLTPAYHPAFPPASNPENQPATHTHTRPRTRTQPHSQLQPHDPPTDHSRPQPQPHVRARASARTRSRDHTHTHAHPHAHAHPHSQSEAENQPRPTKQAAPRDGFVNYTPRDHTVLMAGVAPSGSSKTKARREREAAERQRAFEARLARVVQAAGGDVGRLRELGVASGAEGITRDGGGGGDGNGNGSGSGSGNGKGSEGGVDGLRRRGRAMKREDARGVGVGV